MIKPRLWALVIKVSLQLVKAANNKVLTVQKLKIDSEKITDISSKFKTFNTSYLPRQGLPKLTYYILSLFNRLLAEPILVDDNIFVLIPGVILLQKLQPNADIRLLNVEVPPELPYNTRHLVGIGWSPRSNV